MKHARVQINVLLLVLGLGAMGAPVVGALRESVQAQAGISRAALGLWVFGIGIVGATVGLAVGMVMSQTLRTTFVRVGAAGTCLGCLLLAAVEPAPGWPLVVLGAAWLALRISKPVTGSSNGIFTDLWESSPHTGVILLHAVNAFGKVAAPLAVMVLGTAVRPTALLFAALFGILTVESLFWPREDLQRLAQIERANERGTRLRLPHRPLVWVCAAQFLFICACEGGSTAILGSLVQELRPAPVDWMPASRWPSAVLVVMLMGIFVGRVVFAFLSLRMRERSIIGVCTACAVFSVPGAIATNPAIYLPCLFLLGLCYSATWPAFFALVARHFPGERTFLSFAAVFFSTLGIWGGTFFSSVIGNADRLLPHALVATNLLIVPFIIFLFATPQGRSLFVSGD